MVAGGGTYKHWELRMLDAAGERFILDHKLESYDTKELQYALAAIQGLIASQR